MQFGSGTEHRSIACLARSAILTLTGIAPCFGNDLPVDLRIERVTVYAQSAVVTRAGPVAIPAGSYRLIVSGLPASIDAKTLRVNVAGGTAQLGEVELANINEGRFVSDAERTLRNRLEATDDQRVVVQDDISTSETQLKLLDSIASNPVGNATRPSVDAANLKPRSRTSTESLACCCGNSTPSPARRFPSGTTSRFSIRRAGSSNNTKPNEPRSAGNHVEFVRRHAFFGSGRKLE